MHFFDYTFSRRLSWVLDTKDSFWNIWELTFSCTETNLHYTKTNVFPVLQHNRNVVTRFNVPQPDGLILESVETKITNTCAVDYNFNLVSEKHLGGDYYPTNHSIED